MVLDETMVKFRGRLKFMQYMKNKPEKWGVKCYLFCDTLKEYCAKIEV